MILGAELRTDFMIKTIDSDRKRKGGMRKVCRKREMGKMEADRQGGEDGAGQTDARKVRRAAPTLRKLGFPLSIILPLPPSFQLAS